MDHPHSPPCRCSPRPQRYSPCTCCRITHCCNTCHSKYLTAAKCWFATAWQLPPAPWSMQHDAWCERFAHHWKVQDAIKCIVHARTSPPSHCLHCCWSHTSHWCGYIPDVNSSSWVKIGWILSEIRWQMHDIKVMSTESKIQPTGVQPSTAVLSHLLRPHLTVDGPVILLVTSLMWPVQAELKLDGYWVRYDDNVWHQCHVNWEQNSTNWCTPIAQWRISLQSLVSHRANMSWCVLDVRSLGGLLLVACDEEVKQLNPVGMSIEHSCPKLKLCAPNSGDVQFHKIWSKYNIRQSRFWLIFIIWSRFWLLFIISVFISLILFSRWATYAIDGMDTLVMVAIRACHWSDTVALLLLRLPKLARFSGPCVKSSAELQGFQVLVSNCFGANWARIHGDNFCNTLGDDPKESIL